MPAWLKISSQVQQKKITSDRVDNFQERSNFWHDNQDNGEYIEFKGKIKFKNGI
jgi:hypothetical protein